MELPIVAPVGGTVRALHVSPGQTVEAGDPLVVIEASP
jgi:biotin carboxyl carrier protein